MDFSIRKLNPSDYEDVLVGWWKDWGWQAPAKDFLPDNGEGGMMVLLEDRPVCPSLAESCPILYFFN